MVRRFFLTLAMLAAMAGPARAEEPVPEPESGKPAKEEAPAGQPAAKPAAKPAKAAAKGETIDALEAQGMSWFKRMCVALRICRMPGEVKD